MWEGKLRRWNAQENDEDHLGYDDGRLLERLHSKVEEVGEEILQNDLEDDDVLPAESS
jgi:hypothetical protein